MKLFVSLFFLIVGMLVSGCASHKHKAHAVVPAAASVIITPDASLSAKVVLCNEAGRFVVLSFPVGKMPAMGESFFLYRSGLKTGEVKITGPQRDSNIVADLVTGDAQVGDEVRDQ